MPVLNYWDPTLGDWIKLIGTGPQGPVGPAGPTGLTGPAGSGATFAANVGGATNVTITHGLATRDVTVELYRNATPWDTVECEVQRPDINNVTFIFDTAPAAAAYRAVIQA